MSQDGANLLDVDAIYDALDRGAPEHALELARRALAASAEDDPVVRYLCGVSLLELDRPTEAVHDLERATELDPDDAEFRAVLARALFRACDFAGAERQARRAVAADESSPDAHWVLALLSERAARGSDAERHFRRAEAADPERFPRPLRLDRGAFLAELALAQERLPETFRRHLEQVAVTVEEVPATEILVEEEPPFDAENLLGLFVGTSLAERSSFGPPAELPPRILLFQRNLERAAGSAEELAEQIAITLYHELGHYLGLDEEELERIDLG